MILLTKRARLGGRALPNSYVAQIHPQLVIVVVSVIFTMVSVVLVVILVIPMALMQLPTLPLVIVVRMVPIAAFIRGAVPTSCHPAVMPPVGHPISFDPGIARTGLRSMLFVAQCRRCAADVYSDLCRGRNAKSGCN